MNWNTIKNHGWQIALGGLIIPLFASVFGVNKLIERIESEPVVVDGYWSGSYFDNGNEVQMALFFTSSQGTLSGNFAEENPLGVSGKSKGKLSGKQNHNDIEFSKPSIDRRKNRFQMIFKGKFNDGAITGRWASPMGSGKFSIRRDE